MHPLGTEVIWELHGARYRSGGGTVVKRAANNRA